MKGTIQAIRYHDFSAGHRVFGHESKCRHLHGHNYRIIFYCQAPNLDDIGRIIDFSVIKSKLCQWLEDEWDHKFLLFEKDPLNPALREITPEDIVILSFNPTAENMAKYLVEEIGPLKLKETGVILTKVKVQETRKCSATYTLKNGWETLFKP